MNNTLTVLGSGSSAGVPVLGCDCAVCRSQDPKNKRLRTAAWIQYEGKSLVLDTGPDFKYQALRAQIPRVDAVLYTHPHSDHINGIDDLRGFCLLQKESLNLYGNAFTMGQLTTRFAYCFEPPAANWARPALKAHVLKPGANRVADIPLTLFELPHGPWPNACYRLGNLAWVSDVGNITDEVIATYLKDLDYLFLDCLMERSSPSHLSVEEAFHYAAKIGAKKTYLIHLSHRLDCTALSSKCPPSIAVAYDGLALDF